jgi:hypothetical protein
MSEHELPEQPHPTPSIDAPQPPVDTSRRRVLQGGLAAGPVVLTLFNRPALGGAVGGACTTPSGFVSANVSQHGNPTVCSGRTPGYWKQQQHFGDWVAPYYPVKTGSNNATLFKSKFSPDLNPANKTFLEVLSPELGIFPSNGPPYDVARHLVASVLNIAKGWVPSSVLTIATVQGIWTEFATTGHYQPTAGVFWDHTAIVDYLLTTMPL